MTQSIDLFINFSIVIFLLFLFLDPIEWIINLIGKSITYIIKKIIKIIIVFYTTIIYYLWIVILCSIIYESINFYQSNNYEITYENFNNIINTVFENIILRQILKKIK